MLARKNMLRILTAALLLAGGTASLCGDAIGARGSAISGPPPFGPCSPEPVTPGALSEKAKKYQRFGDFRPPLHFYSDDSRKAEAFDAAARFEENKASFEDLLGWRVSFEDFCRTRHNRRRFAATDITAKSLLVKEMLSPKYEKISPEIAREQFALSLALIEDLYSEFHLEADAALKAYAPLIDVYEKTASRERPNLVGETAIYLYERSRSLSQRKWALRVLVAQTFLRRCAEIPEEILGAFRQLPESFRGNAGASADGNAEDEYAALAAFLETGATGADKEKLSAALNRVRGNLNLSPRGEFSTEGKN